MRLEGNGHTQDSFSLAVRVAAARLGVEATVEEIAVLSTNPFAPVLMRSEDCSAWWQFYTGAGSRLDLVASRFGLRVKRLDLPECELPPDDPGYADHRIACAAVIRAALDRGEVVLTPGGWQPTTEHGFNPWCWWGLLSSADPETGDLQGECLNGRDDNPLFYVDRCFALSGGGESTLDAAAAERAAFGAAVHRIRSDGEPYVSEDLRYGRRAIDLWIERMERVPFCEACAERSASCAVSTAWPVLAGARFVATRIAERAPAWPEDARPHLGLAVENYRALAERLAPAVMAEDDRNYTGIVGDLDRQREHVEEVLRPMRKDLGAAADALEVALGAS